MESQKNHGFTGTPMVRSVSSRLSPGKERKIGPGISLWILLSAATAFPGCAALSRRDESSDDVKTVSDTRPVINAEQILAQKEQRITELETSNQTLQAKIENLEAKLRAAESQGDLPGATASTKPTPRVGGDVLASLAANDPEAGLAIDASVQSYRQAKILFDAAKYPESILAFSAFLERYPAHTLAGVAQYYLAEAYAAQGEFALAEQEFFQVIGKYPRSSLLSFAYQKVGFCLRKQGKLAEAKAAEAQVEALFPHSPALLEVRRQQSIAAVSAATAEPPVTTTIAPSVTSASPIPETAPEVHDASEH